MHRNISYSTTNKMHLLSQIIYSCTTVYMFRTVFPSITRNSKLRIQQWYTPNSRCYLLLSGMHLLSQIIYSCKTLYVFRAVFPSVIRSSKLRIQHMSKSRCYLLLSGMRWNCSISSPMAAGSSGCLKYTIAVYAVLRSWWWTEKPPETCRALYKNK